MLNCTQNMNKIYECPAQYNFSSIQSADAIQFCHKLCGSLH